MHPVELWRNFSGGNETGSPGRAVSLHLARLLITPSWSKRLHNAGLTISSHLNVQNKWTNDDEENQNTRHVSKKQNVKSRHFTRNWDSNILCLSILHWSSVPLSCTVSIPVWKDSSAYGFLCYFRCFCRWSADNIDYSRTEVEADWCMFGLVWVWQSGNHILSFISFLRESDSGQLHYWRRNRCFCGAFDLLRYASH